MLRFQVVANSKCRTFSKLSTLNIQSPKQLHSGLIRMGHPSLRKRSLNIEQHQLSDPQFAELIANMKRHLTATNAVGIAAPQLGVNYQIFIAEILPSKFKLDDCYLQKLKSLPLTVFINPTLKFHGEQKHTMYESCLSVPGLIGKVQRYKHITVSYLDLNGQQMTLSANDFIAGVLQHEADHLNGHLFIDRIESTESLSFVEEFQEFRVDDQAKFILDTLCGDWNMEASQ